MLGKAAIPLDMDLLSAWPEITSAFEKQHAAPNPHSQRILVETNKAARSKAAPKPKDKAQGKAKSKKSKKPAAKPKSSKKATGTKKPDTAYNVARKKFFEQLLA